MSKELLDLLAKIKAKKQEVKDLTEEGKIAEAKEAKKELIELNDKFELLADLDEDEQKEAEDKAKKKATNKAKKVSIAFVGVMKSILKKETPKEEDLELYDAMSEGTKKDGGYLVPEDIRTEVKELRRSEDALEELVNVETVTTLSGSRVIEKDADHTPFDNVDEAEDFPEENTPEFENVEYKCKKKGGILKLTAELLADSAENILKYIRKWIAKKSKATRNALIVKTLNEAGAGNEVVISDLDDLKDIFNTMLDPAIALSSGVLTNQDGFNFLDKIKDEKGNYILQPDPTQPTKRLLFGIYPVKVASKKTYKNVNYDEGKAAPIICGDLKEAITIFDREQMTIDLSDIPYWKSDHTGVKVRERLDIQQVDASAFVFGVVPITESATTEETTETTTTEETTEETTETTPLTAEQLAEMTKAQILAAATEAGYELDVTESNTKEEIIAAYLAAAEAAANA